MVLKVILRIAKAQGCEFIALKFFVLGRSKFAEPDDTAPGLTVFRGHLAVVDLLYDREAKLCQVRVVMGKR